jgi:ABC-type transporter MlaC component
MKKILTVMATLLCASAIMLQAQDAAAPSAKLKKLTPEQQAVMKDMLAKYDTNKDGKLDKTERAAMSQEDKNKMAAVGLGKGKKAAAAAAVGAMTNAPAARN